MQSDTDSPQPDSADAVESKAVLAETPPPAGTGGPAELPTAHSALRQLRVNIGNAFRLALFLRVPEARMPAGPGQLIAFVGFGTIVPLAGSLADTGIHGEIHFQALQGILFHVALMLCAGVMIALVARRPEKSLAVVQMMLMIAVAVDLLGFAASFIPVPDAVGRTAYRFVGRYASLLPAIWLAATSLVATVRLLHLSLRGRFGAALIATLIIGLPLATNYRDRDIWGESYADSKAKAESYLRDTFTQEDIFYAQPQLLERELSALRPQVPGKSEVFFIGMAGHAYQDVFRKEVDAVAQLMEERFDAKGHTIRLINNRHTMETMPIASLTSLDASLKRVAATMDIEEDILVLFLTSHGSEEHRFSLDLYPMQFNELDPQALRETLDESGIKYRVVVVSACYSGGFIEPLKNDNTLVITASAADRNSFGCSNENDWTYFGKAYFDQALRKTTSFTEAFALAKPAIEARESKDNFTPSSPQISIGTGISGKLRALQKQLDQAVKSAAKPSAAGQPSRQNP